ncbi:hypothetical protein [Actinacidiphila acididurans]|uniref:Uncharacterized protein n=1 Tax=Actinacidiphila acididurans TaxID=2784346 RepID=A0ABS2U2A6_9ACTN|nr:hypothetical protein [Actinacidiphila acididurans]MBM9509182.1 hypothetical protein [Actinacidiphila acididurans]
MATFAKNYSAKLPKVVKKITDVIDELPACYHFPAEHWTKLVESAQRTSGRYDSCFMQPAQCGAMSRITLPQ